MAEERVFKGSGGAAGIARGPVLVLQRSHDCPEKAPQGRPSDEWAAFEAAQAEAIARVDMMLDEAKSFADDEAHSPQGTAIFESYEAILRDPVLVNLVKSDIFNARVSAGFAVWNALGRIRGILEGVQSPHIAEKSVDLENVRGLLLEELGANESEGLAPSLSLVGAVVVATLLSPQEMLKLVRARVAAIVCEQGSRNSHVAILARNFNIPAVLGARGVLAGAQSALAAGADASLFLVDGSAGVVVANPSSDTQRTFEARRAYWKLLGKELHERARLPALTTDGQHVEVFANADSSLETSAISAAYADGVGLFRMESYFLSRTELPSEADVTREISALAAAFPSKPVTIRLLDAGADKSIPALSARLVAKGLVSEVEALTNPMGLRGVRVLLRDTELLQMQCRAAVRANSRGNVRVMIPFVTGLEEVEQVRTALMEAWQAVSRETPGLSGKTHTSRPQTPTVPVLGVMIETPAAVALADLLANEVGFFSIGTNDLTQHTLVIDRASAEVSKCADAAHPALLRFLSRTVEAANEAGIPVSLCGEAASEAPYAELLIGLGLRQLSCSPHAIPLLKETIRSIDAAEAHRFVTALKKEKTLEGVRALLQSRFRERFGTVLEPEDASLIAVKGSQKASA
ncbi:MAG: phosphoenolpyruvate--protein phosphotransferase [Silvanigrellales bacterium]|nr:phosphoenolpyruvate--protein phosphotransferase [Silvanigrellales bacterium]